VDDASTVLRVLESVLREAGYSVECVDNPAAVQARAREFRPDLVFLDFSLPGASAFDLARTLSRDRVTAGVPIVLMSSSSDSLDAYTAPELGIVDHMTKPFAPQALLAVVEHTLRKTGERPLVRQPTCPALVPVAARTLRDEHEAVSRVSAAVVAALAEVVSLEDLEPVVVGRLSKLLGGDALTQDLRTLVRWRAHGPALAGDLARVAIADVLQMLGMQRKTGMLVVTRAPSCITLAISGGAVRLVTGENMGREFLIGSILVREKLIDPGELTLLMQNRHGGGRKRLGSQVVGLGYVSREDLARALKRQSTEFVYELLRWRRGLFEFREVEELPADLTEFDFEMTPDELLMEGYRRVDEWTLIESVLPSFSLVPVRLAGGLERMGDPGLTDEEREVYDKVDGTRRAQDIIDQVGHGAFVVAKVLYRLISARVVGIRSPDGPRTQPPRGGSAHLAPPARQG
jgi:DNA-binding response OmpR family regulator